MGLGQQGFQAVGLGSCLCGSKYFYDFHEICQKFHSNDFPMAQQEGQHGSEAVGMGSNPSFYLHCQT